MIRGALALGAGAKGAKCPTMHKAVRTMKNCIPSFLGETLILVNSVYCAVVAAKIQGG